jgi:iron complex outermembrane recepter protein
MLSTIAAAARTLLCIASAFFLVPVHLAFAQSASQNGSGNAEAPSLPVKPQNQGQPSSNGGVTPQTGPSASKAPQNSIELPAIEVKSTDPRPKTPRPAGSAGGAISPASSSGQDTAEGRNGTSGAGVPPLKQRYQLPQTAESIAAKEIQERVNAVDTEDALKYFPSLFLRKRNNGDTQAVLATRTWGVGSSARSLVYADDILLSTLIANNNTIGAPRWGQVSPGQIARIDFLYGPFAAAYPGNSIGGVVQITTKMPDKPQAMISQTESFQDFNRYGTKDIYRTDQTNVSVGNRNGDVSWIVTGNYQNSYSQPLFWVTNPTIPANTSGAIPALNKLGQEADVVGAGGLLHSEIANLNAKFAWDISSGLKATYQIGYWSNDTNSAVQTYLRDNLGNPTYAGIATFANDNYTLHEKHLTNSLSLKTDTNGVFDWDASVSNYYFLEDIQRNPFAALNGPAAFTAFGKILRMDGTNWTNGDLKGIWRPYGNGGEHEVSFGFHVDQYVLNSPTYATANWQGGPDSTSTLYTNSKGVTMTEAFWIQDAWRFAPHFKLTVGGRIEDWQAFDGFNLNTAVADITKPNPGEITSTTAQNQPERDALRFSPKASLGWTPSAEWEVTGSFGQATRFPTVTELYQLVSAGGVFANPNPNLKPEEVLSEELAIERKFKDGKLRLSIFNENVHDALISQIGAVAGTPVTFVTNVDAVRNTGVELAGKKEQVLIDSIGLFGSVTFVDSRILKDPAFVAAVGKHVPNVPDWRATFGVTYKPTADWVLTAAARYSGKQYSTLDNTDKVSNVFGAFDSFLVVDLRAQYKIDDKTWFNFGIDNVNNEKYTLFHPFPERTFVASIKKEF